MDFTIEELMMNAWPSIQTMLYDGWIIRMANGYTKRANSINPIYSPERNVSEKIKYCENIYRKNNLPVIFKIVQCNEYKNIDQKLNNMDYEKIDLTSVQIHNNINGIKNINNEIIVNNYFSNDWKNCFYECNGINDSNLIKTIETMLGNIKLDIIAVHKKINGTSIGCGYGVIENGFVGLFDIIVNKEYRNKGYGKEIVEGILCQANEHGIEKAYLSVVDNNTFAKKLYGKIGFNEIYKYWYRKKA
jgi:GNAT superfamily N-acetyltransferase